MATIEKPVIHMGENSPEYVAYLLFKHIVAAEGKSLGAVGKTPTVDRQYTLSTYAECLRVVKYPGAA